MKPGTAPLVGVSVRIETCCGRLVSLCAIAPPGVGQCQVLFTTLAFKFQFKSSLHVALQSVSELLLENSVQEWRIRVQILHF